MEGERIGGVVVNLEFARRLWMLGNEEGKKEGKKLIRSSARQRTRLLSRARRLFVGAVSIRMQVVMSVRIIGLGNEGGEEGVEERCGKGL